METPAFTHGLLLSLLIFCCVLLLIALWWHYQRAFRKHTTLIRAIQNPILSPIKEHAWESRATFNAAAIDINGVVRIFYRALGDDGISRIGYAESTDGVTISKRLPYPVFELTDPRMHDARARYDRSQFASGGGWGGAEDPRAVRIGDRIYLTFNTFDGWDFIRASVTSISVVHVTAHRFLFSTPLYLSAKNQIHKNWVLFPEKREGKFLLLHSLTPRVQIASTNTFEDLHSDRSRILSHYDQKNLTPTWDWWVRGPGPAPLETPDGWLVLYHAMYQHDRSRYHIGALLLDKNYPSRVLARATAPILSPEKWYENEWKPGIVYACGAVVRADTLFVYYGGGDQTVNVATMSLSTLLSSMKKQKTS